jgi:hypothetical protein
MEQRLIDANALKERKFPNGESEYATGWNDAISAIMVFQPIIYAEPVRHGKWIEGKCNRCGEHAPYWSMASTYYRSNFCPNCGARMDAE